MRYAIVLALALCACGGTEPCATSAACPEGTVCNPDGTCRALAGDPRFVRGIRLEALDWGGTSTAHPSDPLPATDVLLLGGDVHATAYLAFGPLTLEAPVARAWLTLHPHPSFAGPSTGGVVVAHRTRPFEGGRVTLRHAPVTVGAAIVARPVLAGGPRPVVLDVTDAARQAQLSGRRRVWLALRASGTENGPAWRFASPRATDTALRPRLSVWMR